jgi:hypothetical protein
VAKYLHLYNLLEHSALAVTEENARILLAAEVLDQAS